MLGLFVLSKPIFKPQGPRKIIIERLKLDNAQIETYDLYISQHRKAIRQTEDQIHQLKNELYKTLNTNSDTLQRNILIAKLGALQMNIEKIHIRHFEEIRDLCKPEQKDNFENLTSEIATLFARGPKREPEK